MPYTNHNLAFESLSEHQIPDPTHELADTVTTHLRQQQAGLLDIQQYAYGGWPDDLRGAVFAFHAKLPTEQRPHTLELATDAANQGLASYAAEYIWNITQNGQYHADKEVHDHIVRSGLGLSGDQVVRVLDHLGAQYRLLAKQDSVDGLLAQRVRDVYTAFAAEGTMAIADSSGSVVSVAEYKQLVVGRIIADIPRRQRGQREFLQQLYRPPETTAQRQQEVGRGVISIAERQPEQLLAGRRGLAVMMAGFAPLAGGAAHGTSVEPGLEAAWTHVVNAEVASQEQQSVDEMMVQLVTQAEREELVLAQNGVVAQYAVELDAAIKQQEQKTPLPEDIQDKAHYYQALLRAGSLYPALLSRLDSQEVRQLQTGTKADRYLRDLTAMLVQTFETKGFYSGWSKEAGQNFATILAWLDVIHASPDKLVQLQQGIPGAEAQASPENVERYKDQGRLALIQRGLDAAHRAKPDDELLSAQQWLRIYKQVAATYDHPVISIDFLLAQAYAEAKFNHHEVSAVGAEGHAQFMPETAEHWVHGSPFDPEAASDGQARFMIHIYERYVEGKYTGRQAQLMTAAGYNAGPGYIRKHGTDLIDGGGNWKEPTSYTKTISWAMRYIRKHTPAAVEARTKAPESEAARPDTHKTLHRERVPDTYDGLVYYNQYDLRWANVPYNVRRGTGRTVATSGCGPSSLAMVISNLTGQKVTPAGMARYAKKHGYRASGGTAHAAFTDIPETYGLQTQQLEESVAEIRRVTEAGGMVIVNGRDHDLRTPATSGGHIYVIYGVTDSGRLKVLDPASFAKTQRTFSAMRDIFDASSMLVAVTKPS